MSPVRFCQSFALNRSSKEHFCTKKPWMTQQRSTVMWSVIRGIQLAYSLYLCCHTSQKTLYTSPCFYPWLCHFHKGASLVYIFLGKCCSRWVKKRDGSKKSSETETTNTHIILLGAAPEVDTTCIARYVEHSQALQTRQRHGNTVTLRKDRVRTRGS